MIIYRATNKKNNKSYIGQTIFSLDSRIKAHLNTVTNNGHFHFHNALRKYGLDGFEWNIIRICDDRKSLDDYEQYYILYYNTFKNGYNMTTGGCHCEYSKESREKIRQSQLGKNNHRFGIKQSPETRQKKSVAMTGFRHTPDSIRKISNYQSNRTKEHQDKLNKSNRNHKISNKTRAQMSKSHLGVSLSAEHRASMCIAQRKRYADKKLQNLVNVLTIMAQV